MERGIVLDPRSFQENTDSQVERNIAIYPRLDTENQAALEQRSFHEQTGASPSIETREKFDPSKVAAVKWGGNTRNE